MKKVSSRFRHATTFNTHDTTYELALRHVVNYGVPARMTRVVNLLAETDVIESPVTILRTLRNRGLDSYKYTDIIYALGKLEALGVVESTGKGYYQLLPNGRATWGKIAKELFRAGFKV